MGLLTSWASFSLCHHLIVRLAAKRANVPSRGQYLILGDDVVIANEKISEQYKLIMRLLRVEVDLSKSHLSTNGKSRCEFAKRLFINGHEVSPLPVRLLGGNALDEASFLLTVLNRHSKLGDGYNLHPGLPAYQRLKESDKQVPGLA